MPTGFRDIDDVTQGLQPGQMIVVAGRPAMGKSTLGIDFARAASLHHGLTSIVFSLEMSKTELAQRIISAETDIPLVALRRADDITPERWNTLNKFWNRMQNAPLFIVYTLAIWLCYFLHYYLTFFCFDFTAGLGLECALVTFVVGSIAVIVPTPNGAGPWHFAVKTMLILYGVADNNALYFVLIVHSVQTLLVIALGIYSWGALAFTKKIIKS